MTLLAMTAPGVPAYGPVPAGPVVTAAVSTAAICAGAAVWLLGTRDHTARRAQLLFKDDARTQQHEPGRDGSTATRSAVRDCERDRMATGTADPEGGGPTAPRRPEGCRADRPRTDTLGTAGISAHGLGTDGLGADGLRTHRLRKSWSRPGRPEDSAGGGAPWHGSGAGRGPASAGGGGDGRAGTRAGPGRSERPWPQVVGLLQRTVRQSGAWCLLAGTVMAVLGDSVLPLLFGLAALPVARRAAKAGRVRRVRDRRADAVITLCGALAGEVRAGRHPGEALLAVARHSEGLAAMQAAVPAAARFGGDVPGALVGAAREPGAEGLLGLAACWRVAVDGGAGLAAGLERLEGALRAERDQRLDLRAQLAGAHSTAALLAGLPVLGLLLGTALGAHPLHVLLHTGAGLGCLAVGGLLEGVGLWWALRIVRNGEDG